MKEDPDLNAFLAKYPPWVQKIASDVRRLIAATLPDVQETLDTSSKVVGYGFGPRYADTVCTIIPSKAGVKLGLAFGASLPDPNRLLEGAGKVHRHVNFKTPAEVKKAGVKALLKAALAAQKLRCA